VDANDLDVVSRVAGHEHLNCGQAVAIAHVGDRTVAIVVEHLIVREDREARERLRRRCVLDAMIIEFITQGDPLVYEVMKRNYTNRKREGEFCDCSSSATPRQTPTSTTDSTPFILVRD